MPGVAFVHTSEFGQHDESEGDRQDDHREHRFGADPGDHRGPVSVAVRYGGGHSQ